MALTPTKDYVKFVRGSKAAFETLAEKTNDTLYFIYDANDTTKGSLYIGSRLIGGGTGTSATSLQDLEDIVISSIGDKQILIYDASSSSWKNGSLSDILTVDDKSIEKANVGTLSLKNFDTATVGSLASKGESDDLTWLTPAQAITALNVYTKDEINEKLNQSLSRKVVTSTDDINLTATDAEKYIYLVPNNKNSYDEYIVANGKLEKVGDWETDLSNYVTKADVGTLVTENVNTVLKTQVGDLSNYGGDNPTFMAVIGDLSSYSAEKTLVDKVAEIDSRLVWSALS